MFHIIDINFLKIFFVSTKRKNKLKHIGIDCDFSQFVLEKNLISMDESFEEYIFFQIFIFNIGFLIDCHVQMQICQSLYI